jgi:hypothetical protein
METITIRDIDIVVVRKAIKNIHLRVYPPIGFVRVSIPQEMTDKAIRIFLIQKYSWIKQQQEEFKKVERISPREFLKRESHYFLGQRYLLEITELTDNTKQKVYVKNKKALNISLKSNTTSDKALKIMDEFYREELKQIVTGLIQKWETNLNIETDSWQIRKMTTKWGTCIPEKKKIILNLELAKKPLRCIEYVVVHELVHLFERNHNKQFVAHMDKFLPNWRALKHELNSSPVSHAEWKY